MNSTKSGNVISLFRNTLHIGCHLPRTQRDATGRQCLREVQAKRQAASRRSTQNESRRKLKLDKFFANEGYSCYSRS